MLAARARQGLKTPSWDNRPVIFDDLVPVWDAFWELSASRRAGFSGPEPLTPSDIKAHVDLSETDTGNLADWYALVVFMDRLYLSHLAEKRKEKEKSTKPKRESQK